MSDSRQRATRSRAAHLGPERRRPMVLDAALRVFIEHGYRGTSMQAIADEAGVTKPVVYECYRNKDKLLLTLLDREEERLLGEITAALPENPSFDDLEGLIASALRAFLNAASGAPQAWRVVFEFQHVSGTVVGERVREARTMLLGRLQALVATYMERTEIRDAEQKTPVVAELLASVAESCARMLVVGHYPWAPDELADFTACLVTRGLEAS